jgi:hypothetical protein
MNGAYGGFFCFYSLKTKKNKLETIVFCTFAGVKVFLFKPL